MNERTHESDVETWKPSRALEWLEGTITLGYWLSPVALLVVILIPLLSSQIDFETTLGANYGIDIGIASTSTYINPEESTIDGVTVLEQSVSGVIDDPSIGQWLTWAIKPLLFMAILWTGLHFARKILRPTIVDHQPFGPDQSRALRNLGLTILIGGYVYAFVKGFVDFLMLSWIEASANFNVGFVLTGGPIYWCVSAFALASLFDYANSLRVENELTV